MKRAFLCLFVMGSLAGSAASAQSYRGTYTLTSAGVTLTLSLDQDAAGRITGTLSSTKGTSFRLEGKITDGIASGTCTGGTGKSLFEADRTRFAGGAVLVHDHRACRPHRPHVCDLFALGPFPFADSAGAILPA